MRGIEARTAAWLAGVVILTLPSTARASCWQYLDFGQLTEGCAGGAAYCYVVSPGVNTPGSIVSSFWSLTTGEPATGHGDDNGSWDDADGWLWAAGPGASLAGAWSASVEIDGCIEGRVPPGKTAEVMAVALSDTDAAGSTGYFAVAATGRQPNGYPQFDFAGGIGRDITLAPIPRPIVASTQRLSWNTWLVRFRPPPRLEIEAGSYSDGSAALDEVVAGYRVHRRDLWGGGPPPTDRHVAAWAPVTGVVPLEATAEITVVCEGQYATYFTLSLVFDSGFETGYVSSNSTPINICGWCHGDADRDGFFTDIECPPYDCDDTDPATHPYAPETNDGKDNQCWEDPGYGVVDEISGKIVFAGKVDLSWPAQAGATLYEAARDESPGFGGPCVTTTTNATSWSDLDAPEPEHAFHYLVRALAPRVGSWGQDSSGAERAAVCP